MTESFRKFGSNLKTQGIGNDHKHTAPFAHVRRDVSAVEFPLFIYLRNIAEALQITGYGMGPVQGEFFQEPLAV